MNQPVEITVVRLGKHHSAQLYLDVATLHIRQIAQGALSRLGPKLLARIYREIALQSGSGLWVALDGTTVAGFISGCRDTRTTFRKVILKTLVALAMFAAGMLFRFRLMQFLRIMLYPLRKGTSSSHASAVCTGIRAELLSVVVSDDYQKRGLGKLLLDTVDDTMREWNVPGFYRVASDLSVAGSQQFYLRSGFQPCHTLTLNDTVLQVYIKEIPGTEIG